MIPFRSLPILNSTLNSLIFTICKLLSWVLQKHKSERVDENNHNEAEFYTRDILKWNDQFILDTELPHGVDLRISFSKKSFIYLHTHTHSFNLHSIYMYILQCILSKSVCICILYIIWHMHYILCALCIIIYGMYYLLYVLYVIDSISIHVHIHTHVTLLSHS